MILLYHGSGATDFEVQDEAVPKHEWERLRALAIKLLQRRGYPEAADKLHSLSFELRKGTNFFNDEFSVLYLRTSPECYLGFEESSQDRTEQVKYALVASVVTEVGPFIRFVAVEVDSAAGPPAVSPPTPRDASESVERALLDAEYLLHTTGPVSAVDRAHTALHGYLRGVAEKASLSPADDAGITQLFKLIREHHPVLSSASAHSRHVAQALRGIASVLDSLNPLRNKGSVAHPNESLLEPAEAMLAINCARTVLHYLEHKLRDH